MAVSAGGAGRWMEHGRRSIYESDWVKLEVADISVPSGERFEHHVVSLPAAAMTVVLDDDGENVLLAWRHRFVPDLWNWELPGGLLDEDETAEATALREVEEETGFRPRTIEHIVTFEPMIGTVNSPHHVFLAHGAEKVASPVEHNEGQFRWIPLLKVPDLIAAGQITNSGTLVGLLRCPVEASTAPGSTSLTYS